MADHPHPTSSIADHRFQLLVNAVTDYAIYMLDPDGRVSPGIAGAERFKGYEADEIIGQHFSPSSPTRIGPPACPNGRSNGSRGGQVRGGGLAACARTARRFWASAVIDPIRDDDGELIGFAKITRDITDEKEAEQHCSQASSISACWSRA